jgi:hypothetical protein
LIPLIAEGFDDAVNPFQGHPINGFRRATFGHGSGIAIQLRIGPKVVFPVKELPVQAFEWQSLRATFPIDCQ